MKVSKTKEDLELSGSGRSKIEQQINRVKLDGPLGDGHSHIFTTAGGADADVIVIVSSYGRGIFCPPGHNRRMEMRQKVYQGLELRAMMPDSERWTVEVHENLGFHVKITRGQLSISQGKRESSYCAQVASTNHFAHHDDPVKALALALKSLVAEVESFTKLLSGVV